MKKITRFGLKCYNKVMILFNIRGDQYGFHGLEDTLKIELQDFVRRLKEDYLWEWKDWEFDIYSSGSPPDGYGCISLVRIVIDPKFKKEIIEWIKNYVQQQGLTIDKNIEPRRF